MLSSLAFSGSVRPPESHRLHTERVIMEEEDLEWSLKSGWRTRDGNLAKHVSLLQVYSDESVRRKYAELLIPADGDVGAAILVPAPDSSGPCEVTGG